MADKKKDKKEVLVKDDVYYYQKGWKQKIGNMTKVYVKGTDYERGVQLGKLLAHEIKSALNGYLSFTFQAEEEVPAFFKLISRWLPFLVKPLLFLLYQKKVQHRIEKYPHWMIKELEGMARGAEIHPFYLKLMNCIGDEENLKGDKEFNTVSLKSCCSFAFLGEDGNLYHGKNLDWIPIESFIDLVCFQQHEDENGHYFNIIGVPGLLHAYEFGMNSWGVSIGLTGRFYRGKRASNLALTNAIELKILRFGKNLKEIQKIYNTKTGFNRTDGLLISSRTDRDYHLFEVTPLGAAATTSPDGTLFTTNTYVHPIFQKNNRQWGNIFNNEFCDPRYKRLKELLSRKPKTLEDAFAILTDTVQPGFEHKTFLGQASINRFTTHVSALMVQGKTPGVWIARDHTYGAYNEYVFFDFSSVPQKSVKKRQANKIIYTEEFKNFKTLMHVRETRYFVSPGKLIEEGEKLLEKEPKQPVFILFVAQNYLKQGKFRHAFTLLKKHPLQWIADYWYCLGRCHLEFGEYEDSRRCFLKTMELPGIDGFSQLVKTVCLVQLIKVNEAMGLSEEVGRLKKELKDLQSKFATPNIGMPDYPYINNIVEELEQIML